MFARNVYLKEFHAVHVRCKTYTVLPRLLLFLMASFFYPQEGANQAVPEALMDMAMKVCGPFHYLSIFYSNSSKALLLCDCLILIRRTPGSGSHVSVTVKEKLAEEREDHACVKDPAWECMHQR